LINYFSDFRYVDPFWRYSRSKFDSCLKSRQILDVFALPNFRGRAFPKSCAHLNTPALRHVAWKIAPNFACFGSPISSGGGPPELLDLLYKAHPDCDHVAVSRRSAEGARRSRDERNKKEEKNITGKT